MGNTIIWYWPEGGDRMVRIDFGRRIHTRQGPTPVYPQTVQESLAGVQSSVIYAGRHRTRFGHTWERTPNGDGDRLHRRLKGLEAHLQRGGTCHVAEDEDLARAGFAVGTPGAGQHSITIDVNLFGNLVVGFLASGRECWVQTDHERFIPELKLCTTNTGLTFTFADGLFADMSEARWVLVREEGSWPALRMPSEARELANAVSHDGRNRVFTLDLPLEEDPATLDLYQVLGTPLPGTDPSPIVIDPDIELLTTPRPWWR